MGKRFFIVCETYKNTGVERKIEAQKKALKKRGRFEPLLESPSSPYQRLYKAQRTIIQKAKEAELIYYRYSALNWLLHRFLIKKMKGRFLLEINTLNRPELKRERGVKGLVKRLFNTVYEKELYQRARGVLVLTPEIGAYVRGLCPIASVTVIDNGYEKRDVFPETDSVIAEKIYNWKKKNYLVGLFAGTFFPWAGVDRMIKRIEQWRNVGLILAGFGPELKGLLSALEAPFHERILYTGPQTESELAGLYEMADFAFSSLALDRIGLRDARPLKTREYLAYGLPVVCGYRENPELEETGLILSSGITPEELEKVCRQKSKEERVKRVLPLLSWEKIYEKIGDLFP